MKELKIVSSNHVATEEEWEAFEKRDDLFEFCCPDNDMVYILKMKGE